jgi:hypothetical protein
MNIQKTAASVKQGRPTLRVTYHSDGTKTETRNPSGGRFNGVHGAMISKSVPDEFRGVTAGRYSAAPGVSFEQAMSEG